MAEISNALDCMHDQQAVVYPGVGITSKENKSDPQPGDPCCTLSTDSRNYLVADGRPQRKFIVRRLTPTECARLQGFPDSFQIVVSDTEAYRQFGNSVVVPLMTDIASLVVKTIDMEEALLGEA